MIKVITFCVGVDVLGFPTFHKHILKYNDIVLNKNISGVNKTFIMEKRVHSIHFNNKNKIKKNDDYKRKDF